MIRLPAVFRPGGRPSPASTAGASREEPWAADRAVREEGRGRSRSLRRDGRNEARAGTGRPEPPAQNPGHDGRQDAAAEGDGSSSPSYRLIIPALAAWVTALILLGCSATAGALTAAVAAVAAALIVCGPRLAKPGRGAATRCRQPRRRRAGEERHVTPHGREHAAVHESRALQEKRATRGRRAALPGRRRAPVPERVVGALRGWASVAVGVLGCVAATAAAVACRVHAVSTGPVAEAAARNATVTAEIVLTGDPRVLPAKGGVFRRESVVVTATVTRIDTAESAYTVHAPVLVLGSGAAWKPLLPSQRLSVRGRLAPADEGELLAGILLVRGQPRVIGEPSVVQRVAGELRAGLRTACDVLPPDQRGLVPALVAGDVSRMDPQVEADFRDAGLGHLTAVSGSNLAVVAGAAIALARLAGLPLPARAAAGAAAMLAFAVVARPSPSVLRALVMGLVATLALGVGRERDGVSALSVAVLGLILFDPALARSFGFALSVCATAGILLLAPRWRDRLAACRLPYWLAEAVAVPAAAQAAVTPVLVLMVAELSPVAVPANLLAGPAVAPATVLGFATAVIAPFDMAVARLVVRPAGWATGWIITVAERAAALPAGTIPWPGGMGGLALLAVATAVLVVVFRHPTGRRAVAAVVCGALVAVLIIRPLVTPWPPRGWLLVACDVGQGDALVIAAGPGRGVVVDTGFDPSRLHRCLRDLGVREVPVVVLTHPHFDHVGGLDGVFRGRSVAAVAVGPWPSRAEGDDLAAALARHGLRQTRVSPGTRWRLGPSEITVLAPVAGVSAEGPGSGARVNNASVVLHVRWRAGSALLSGDIETEAQADLVRRGFPRVDILKVPHHGSARQDPAFLRATGARAALISVGAGNDYGHPAPSTIAWLVWCGMRVHRTDLSGDLAVVGGEDGLSVVSRGVPARARRENAGPPPPSPATHGITLVARTMMARATGRGHTGRRRSSPGSGRGLVEGVGAWDLMGEGEEAWRGVRGGDVGPHWGVVKEGWRGCAGGAVGPHPEPAGNLAKACREGRRTSPGSSGDVGEVSRDLTRERQGPGGE